MSEPAGVMEMLVENALGPSSPTLNGDDLSLSPASQAMLTEGPSSFLIAVATSLRLSLPDNVDDDTATFDAGRGFIPPEDEPQPESEPCVGPTVDPAPSTPPRGRGEPRQKTRGWDPNKSVQQRTQDRICAIKSMIDLCAKQEIVTITMQDQNVPKPNPFGWKRVQVVEDRRKDFVKFLDDLIGKHFGNRNSFNSALNGFKLWKFVSEKKGSRGTRKDATARFIDTYYDLIGGFSDQPGFKLKA